MTNAELGVFAAGGILGGMFAMVMAIMCIYYVIILIAGWKILTKAGEPGWKILIPIYNVYMLYKISGLSFWLWFVLPIFGGGILSGIIAGITGNQEISSILSGIIQIIILVRYYCALADAFGKETGFKLGLIFLSPIFFLILGFGSAEYVGPANKD